MAALVQQIGTVATVNAAIAAMQAQPNNAAEAALVTRLITFLQTEVNNMGAVNQLQVYIEASHTEKTCQINVIIDKATPFAGQVVQLQNNPQN